LTKQDIITKMAEASGISKAAANKALDGFLASVSKALKGGDKVTLIGFGTFSVKKRSARKGRNPQTGATIKIPATKVPKFNPGKKLRESVK
jgi:DNA-binding protein HU-beta